jgi:hypothetical protein
MISTRDLSLLPAPSDLKPLCQSLAMLDAILSPEWQFRYYSYNAHWSFDLQLASMRNGSGDDFHIVFSNMGALLKGFAHESSMSPSANALHTFWPGVLDSVPPSLKDFLGEPALNISDTTFCVWRTRDEEAWQRGTIIFPEGRDPDGSEYLLSILDSEPHSYRIWAEQYYGRSVDLEAVRHIYRHDKLTPTVVARLNANISISDLTADLTSIGY